MSEVLSYEFFLELAIILVAAKVFGILFRKLHLPQVVGVLVAGIIIGPNVLGLVKNSEFLSQIAELGVIMLMFTAGLETDLKEIKKTGLASLLVATLGVIVPLGGGYLLYSLFNGGFAPWGTHECYSAIFTGLIITATSVGITVETLREMGRLKTRVGTIILSAAIIDDIIGIVLLSFVIGLKKPDVNPAMVLLNTFLFFVFVGVVGVAAHYIFKYFDKKYLHKRRVPIYGFVLCLLLSYTAEHFFGIADITGAFLAGIVLCNLRSSEYIVEKIDVNSYMFFGPIFFASIGLKTEITNISPILILFSVLYLGIALITKIIGCGLGAKIMGYSMKDSYKIGVGMMARGEVGLIVAQKGFSAGMIDQSYFPAVIFLVIVSSIATPIMLKLAYRKEPMLEDAEDGSEKIVKTATDIGDAQAAIHLNNTENLREAESKQTDLAVKEAAQLEEPGEESAETIMEDSDESVLSEPAETFK